MKVITLMAGILVCSLSQAAFATVAPACGSDTSICASATSAPSCSVNGAPSTKQPTCPPGQAPKCSTIEGVTVAVCQPIPGTPAPATTTPAPKP